MPGPDRAASVRAISRRPCGRWIAARTAAGEPVVAGRKITGFSNEEEKAAGKADKAKWLLEDRLRELGADVSTGPAWQPFTVVGVLPPGFRGVELEPADLFVAPGAAAASCRMSSRAVTGVPPR